MSSVDVELFILKKIEHSFKHPVCDMIIFVCFLQTGCSSVAHQQVVGNSKLTRFCLILFEFPVPANKQQRHIHKVCRTVNTMNQIVHCIC